MDQSHSLSSVIAPNPGELFAGLLSRQGHRKLNGFVMATLDRHATGGLAVKARCAGLLGAIVRDVAPTGYAIVDDRYHKMLAEVLAIFERNQPVQRTIEERIAAAEALGQAAWIGHAGHSPAWF